jgi:SAM-dependent methyltransferase
VNCSSARQRRSASLGLRSSALLRLIIRLSQSTAFGPSATPQTFELLGDGENLDSGRREYDDGRAFFRHFDGTLEERDLADLHILDLGCGYGGRTVYYALDCKARFVQGIEIFPEVVRRCDRLARHMNCPNASFQVAFAENLPFADESFDAVISYDVLEHVVDPFGALAEIARVLKPGGRAWLVLPTYRGARSSHLDYLTRIPALHRVFDADVIISVVNEFLRSDPTRYGTRPQPAPSISSLGRMTLPTLNGLTLPDARRAIDESGLSIEHMARTPIVTERVPLPGARLVSRVLDFWSERFRFPEFLIANLAFTAIRRSADPGPSSDSEVQAEAEFPATQRPLSSKGVGPPRPQGRRQRLLSHPVQPEVLKTLACREQRRRHQGPPNFCR